MQRTGRATRRVVEGVLLVALVGFVGMVAMSLGGDDEPVSAAPAAAAPTASGLVDAAPTDLVDDLPGADDLTDDSTDSTDSTSDSTSDSTDSTSDSTTDEVAGEPVSGPAAWVTASASDDRRLATVEPSDADPSRTVSIDVDDRRQTWAGAGAALTDSSVDLLSGNDAALDLLFGDDVPGGAMLDVVRLPLSATDFSADEWTWDFDVDTAEVAPTDEAERALAVLDEIVRRESETSVVAAAWSGPDTVADVVDGVGRSLRPGSEVDYGRMLAAQAEWLVERGVPLAWLSLGNEPGHVADYPTMLIDDAQLVELATTVAPALDAIDVDLLAVDHNWADRDRVDAVLAAAPDAFDAAAFHCYDGDPSQMAGLDVPILVTECTGTDDSWAGTFEWDARQLIAGSIDNGSTSLVMWNLALDPQNGPKRDWGCNGCRGLLTVDPDTGDIEPGPEFYVLGHLTRAAQPGSVVLGVEADDDLAVVAFLRPDGLVGAIGHNGSGVDQIVEFVTADGRALTVEVAAGDLVTVTF